MSLLHVDIDWVPLVLGFAGAIMLFPASMSLIFESRLALATTFEEMDSIDRTFMHRG